MLSGPSPQAIPTTSSSTPYVFSHAPPPTPLILSALVSLQISYPLSVINAVISFGIVYLHFRPYHDWTRPSPFAVGAAAFFGAANVFLFVVPFVRPPPGGEPYIHLPYWTHAVAGWAVFGLGFLYWIVWGHVLPKIGGYRLERREEVGQDGLRRHVFVRVKSV